MFVVYLLKVVLLVMIFLDMASINYRPVKKQASSVTEVAEKSSVRH